jgi:hypothetical protein
MKEYGWIVWLLISVLMIVQAMNKNRAKAAKRPKTPDAEDVIGTWWNAGQKAAPGQAPLRGGQTAHPNLGPVRPPTSAVPPMRGSLAQILEELARQSSEGYEPVNEEFTGFEDDGPDDCSTTESADAEARYVGGEMGTPARYEGGEMGAPARHLGCETGGVSTHPMMSREVGLSASDARDETNEVRSRGVSAVVLADMLGGEFDLRRAVVEAEILTPKYVARY